MASIAILIANAHYAKQDDLDCCVEDLAAVKSLVEAAGRHSDVQSILDADADAMRATIRDALGTDGSIEEVFFYFSGHGTQVGTEFFYCGVGFDSARPNETGISHTELQNMLRNAEPDLLVKVVDACASGTLLVKSDRPALQTKKEGFRNVVQIASCLYDQNSFGGEPLSEFTRSFCEACLRKSDGPIYYGDIINTLRDDFLDNEDQTPFFVSQGTGREVLVDDATRLAEFREMFVARWSSVAGNDIEPCEDSLGQTLVPAKPITPQELLAAAEERMVGPVQAKSFIDTLFDGVLARFDAREFDEFFELQTVAYSTYRETTAHDYMAKILAREVRSDNFVTAEVVRTKQRPFVWESAITSIMRAPEWDESFTLELNCRLERAQLRVMLTPKYRALQRLVLVLSCAPSLERCYVFEVVTQHARADWDGFDEEGREIVKRWYKMGWDDDPTSLTEKICLALENAVREHIAATTERLAKD